MRGAVEGVLWSIARAFEATIAQERAESGICGTVAIGILNSVMALRLFTINRNVVRVRQNEHLGGLLSRPIQKWIDRAPCHTRG